MIYKDKLSCGIAYIAWGNLLIYFNINLGMLDILPNWFGYILLLCAIPFIADEEKTMKLLRPFAIILTIYEGIFWIFPYISESDLYPFSLIITVISLYFHFQLLTNVANIAEKYDCPQYSKILMLRNARTILLTLAALLMAWEEMELIYSIILIAVLIVIVWICIELFSFKRLLDKYSQINS